MQQHHRQETVYKTPSKMSVTYPSSLLYCLFLRTKNSLDFLIVSQNIGDDVPTLDLNPMHKI